MKSALYLRVSTSDQNLESQRMELLTYASAKGLGMPREFTDVLSGAKRDRPGLDALLAAAKAGEVDTILCVKLDRMARSLGHFAEIVATLERCGVALVCTSQGIDTSKSNACGRLQMNVLSAVAEFERELIRERTRAGLAVARASGKTLGRVSVRMKGLDRAAIVAAWRAAGGKDYRGLGQMLGGVSGATAWRVAAKYPAPSASEALDVS